MTTPSLKNMDLCRNVALVHVPGGFVRLAGGWVGMNWVVSVLWLPGHSPGFPCVIARAAGIKGAKSRGLSG